MRDGLKVIVFEQTAEVLEKRFGFRVAEYGLRQVFPRVPDHPLLAGLDVEDLRDWRGEATILPPRLTYTIGEAYRQSTPVVKWCGSGRAARLAVRQSRQRGLGADREAGPGRFPADRRRRLQPPVQPAHGVPRRQGPGAVLPDGRDRTDRERSGGRDACSVTSFNTSRTWKPGPSRKAVYVGDPAGKRHLEFAGIPVAGYEGARLIARSGPGRGARRRADAGPEQGGRRRFLEPGGNVLALGLDESEANAFLPFQVGMKKAEHIAAFFEPPGRDSLLAGIGPADVHNRAPRKLPLVTSGATVLGDGVLAKAHDANVVFCQLAPYSFSRAEGKLPSFVVNGDDAADGKQSALLTLGTASESGMRFGQRVKAGEVGKTYTFAVSVKAAWRLGLASPGNRTVVQPMGPRRQGREDCRPGGPLERIARHLQGRKAIPAGVVRVHCWRARRRSAEGRSFPDHRGRLRTRGVWVGSGSRIPDGRSDRVHRRELREGHSVLVVHLRRTIQPPPDLPTGIVCAGAIAGQYGGFGTNTFARAFRVPGCGHQTREAVA